MKSIIQIAFLFSVLFLSFQVSANERNNTTQKLSRNGSGFLENKGQMMDDQGNLTDFILFKAESQVVDFYITTSGLTYIFKKINEEKSISQAGEEKIMDEEFTLHWERVEMLLEGAIICKDSIVKEYPSIENYHYYLGHCPKGIRDVKKYGKITIKSVYPGIDWVFYNSSDKGYKYDFVVHSGANPDAIQLVYRTKERLNLTEEGEIKITTEYGNLSEAAPVSFLDLEEVASSFQLNRTVKNEFNGIDSYFGFEFSSEVKEELGRDGILTIDPQLVWATFFGGSSEFTGPMVVETDDNNNCFIAGYTNTFSFPTVDAGSFYQGFISLGIDGFLSKFDSNGQLLWSTFYGGNNDDWIKHGSLDPNGNFFATGRTKSTNFPTLDAGTFFKGPTTIYGDWDGFIIKFDDSGNLIWGTYLGATPPIADPSDQGHYIISDDSGNIFVTGVAGQGFPLLDAGTYFQNYSWGSDAFLAKFDNNGNLIWSTYYGGDGNDSGSAIAIDDNNNVFLIGGTNSPDLPTLNSASFFQGANAGGYDLFIVKFDNNGNRLWATYYGGSGGDAQMEFEGDLHLSAKIDLNQDLYIMGRTMSIDFPTQDAGGYFDNSYSGNQDCFILKFDNLGNRLWSTYHGGNGFDHAWSYDNIAIDQCNNMICTFNTESSDLITNAACTDASYIDSTFNGDIDIYVAQFSESSDLKWASYFGGDGQDLRGPLSIDTDGNLWLSGEWAEATVAGTYPLVDLGGTAYYDGVGFLGGHKGFISKFSLASWSSANTSSTPASCSCDGTATVTISGACPPFDFIWGNGSQTLATMDTTNTISNLCAGTYPIQIIAECDTLFDTVIVTSLNPTPCDLTINTVNDTICQGDCIDLIAQSNGISIFPIVYQWDNGIMSNDSVVNVCPAVTTTYTVIATDGAGDQDTAAVTIFAVPPPFVNLGNDTTLCFGDVITLDAENPGVSYLWQDGSSNQTLEVSTAGMYWVEVSIGSCIHRDTINVDLDLLDVNLGNDTLLCNSPNITLDAGNTGALFLWSDGITTTQTFNVLTSGIYWVEVSSDYCSVIDSIVIEQQDLLAQFSSSDTAGCIPLVIGFSDVSAINVGTISSWNWNFGDGGTSDLQNPQYTYLLPGMFDVQLTVSSNEGCS
ncbi:MAG: PKD domain-containing protein, partial [Crocinitomicaceae bacterium]